MSLENRDSHPGCDIDEQGRPKDSVLRYASGNTPLRRERGLSSQGSYSLAESCGSIERTNLGKELPRGHTRSNAFSASRKIAVICLPWHPASVMLSTCPIS